MKHNKEEKKSKKKIIIIAIAIILVLGIGAALGYFFLFPKPNNNEQGEETNQDNDTLNVAIEEKQVQIFNGNDRPIAVMIDNHSDAWPQAGLNKAYMVYEIIVEGGETRLMA
jgi:Protein of unknown function (DUF3048).